MKFLEENCASKRGEMALDISKLHLQFETGANIQAKENSISPLRE